MEKKIKIQIIIFLFMIGILVIIMMFSNPMKKVPVINVKMTLIENQGIVETSNYTLNQDVVGYVDRPKKTVADSFPAITARVSSLRGKIGPWEALPYNGNGSYSFNIGFDENNYPLPNDTVYVSIMIVDKDGERIGYIKGNMKWK